MRRLDQEEVKARDSIRSRSVENHITPARVAGANVPALTLFREQNFAPPKADMARLDGGPRAPVEADSA